MKPEKVVRQFTSEDFARWGSAGGKARRAPRKISKAQARRMGQLSAAARAAKRKQDEHPARTA